MTFGVFGSVKSVPKVLLTTVFSQTKFKAVSYTHLTLPTIYSV